MANLMGLPTNNSKQDFITEPRVTALVAIELLPADSEVFLVTRRTVPNSVL